MSCYLPSPPGYTTSAQGPLALGENISRACLPFYSQNASSKEVILEHTFPPPPYPEQPITRTATTSSTSSRDLQQPLDHIQDHYKYSAGNITLTLGLKDPELQYPSYGCGASIRGSVTLKKHTFVERILIKLEGSVQTVQTQAGVAVAHSASKLLNMGQILFSRSKSTLRPSGAASYAFEFVLPATVQNGTDPLPPTFRASQALMEGTVKYTLKVQVVKSGLWPGEYLHATIHYLPKTHPNNDVLLWPRISLIDAKRFGLHCNDKWKTVEARAVAPIPQGMRVFVAIPRTAQAVAGSCFPANVSLTVPGISSEKLGEYVKSTTIHMVRSVILATNNGKSSHTCRIGRGNVQQVERELAGDSSQIIRAWMRPGVKWGEASWRVGDIIEVKYSLRVTVKDPVTDTILYQHEEDIEMFSHPSGETGFEEWDQPTPNLLLGTSLHARTAAFR